MCLTSVAPYNKICEDSEKGTKQKSREICTSFGGPCDNIITPTANNQYTTTELAQRGPRITEVTRASKLAAVKSK